jgi:hypothetical protein
MLHARVQSPFLPDLDHANFLVDQLQDVLEVCSITTLGDISTRPMFGYGIAPSPTSQSFGNGTTSTTATVSASATCTGQVIGDSTQKRAVEYFHVYDRAEKLNGIEERQTLG